MVSALLLILLIVCVIIMFSCGPFNKMSGRGQSLKEQLETEIKRVENQLAYLKSSNFDQAQQHFKKIDSSYDFYKEFLYDSQNNLIIMKQQEHLIKLLKKCENKSDSELNIIIKNIKSTNDVIDNNVVKNNLGKDLQNMRYWTDQTDLLKYNQTGHGIGDRLMKNIWEASKLYDKHIKKLL